MGLTCPECGAPMKLRDSKYGLFYGCTQYPLCQATHGAHPDGKPLGIPANKETKLARIEAHGVFNKLWEEMMSQGLSKTRARKLAYTWLQKQLSLSSAECHIAMFDKPTCGRVVDVCTRRDGWQEWIGGPNMLPVSRALLQVLLDHHKQAVANHPVGTKFTPTPYLIRYGKMCADAGCPEVTRSVSTFLLEIAQSCSRHGWPPINALAVNDSGMPGNGYENAPGCSLVTWPAEVEKVVRYSGYPAQAPQH